MADEPEFLTTRQLSKLIKHEVVTLRTWRAAGKGPNFVKFGRKVLYDARDVEAWIDKHRVRLDRA